jgi:hypothetical protein
VEPSVFDGCSSLSAICIPPSIARVLRKYESLLRVTVPGAA